MTTYRIQLIDDVAALEGLRLAWQNLAEHAVEPNAFYEPWMFLPALRAFRGGKKVAVALIYGADPSINNGASILCGLFPLERSRSFKRMPVSVLKLWEYSNCYLCAPLLREGHAAEALGAFLDWLESDAQGAALLECSFMPGEGPVYQLLVDQFRRRSTITYAAEQYTRAFLVKNGDVEEYLNEAVSPAKRRDLNRKQRRLGELGTVELRSLEPGGDFDRWADDFLRLEASGWKGEEGTALGSKARSRQFFLEFGREAFATNRLMLIGLYLNDRPVGLRCSFASGEGSFFFKPAYEESFGKYSPGVLLEIENIRRVHVHPTVRSMDSCTSPDNVLLNSLWLDRRLMQTLVIAANRASARLMLSVLPIFRWGNRLLGRYRAPAG